MLGIMVLAVFSQVVRHDFVNYDDNEYVYDNAIVRGGLSMEGLRWAFTKVHSDNWHPLTWLSHMLDCQLYGLKPAGHHLTNVLLHAANTVLLFLAMRSLTALFPVRHPVRRSLLPSVALAKGGGEDECSKSDGVWRSAIVAAIWAIHPLRVESVAWIAERKDLLCGLFFMLTLWAYARYVRSGRWERGLQNALGSIHYWLVVLFFALGLMSKPMLVTLPFLLLLLDYWPLARTKSFLNPTSYFLLLEKLPLFLMSVASCAVTVFAQQTAMMDTEKLSLLTRSANAAVAYVIYLKQTVWPVGLTAFYPWPKTSLDLVTAGGCLLLLAAISVVVYRQRNRAPFAVVGWLWYLGMLVPVIGLLQVGNQAHADRYTYLPQIGLLVMGVWILAELSCSVFPSTDEGHTKIRSYLLPGGALAIVLLALGICTWNLLPHWRNSVSLWTRNFRLVYPNPLTCNNLGAALMKSDRLQEAGAMFRKALELDPNYEQAHLNLGAILAPQGRITEAMRHFRRALELDPENPHTHYYMGLTHMAEWKLEEAVKSLQTSVRLKPDHADAHGNLAAVLIKQGKLEEAAGHCEQALRIRPDRFQTWGTLGMLRLKQGKTAEAIHAFRRVLSINPTSEEARKNLEQALKMQRD